MDSLDLTPLLTTYQGVGSLAHAPDLMLKMVLWQIFDGRPSPAQWWRAMRTDVAMLWLGQGIQPSRSAWYTFRERLGPVVSKLNHGVIRQAIYEGLIDPLVGVIDGTAVRTQASRHRLQNEAQLERRQEALREAIEKDGASKARKPRTKSKAKTKTKSKAKTETKVPQPRWMAKTPKGRRQQAQRYATAAAVLERRLAENARKPKDRRLDPRHVVISVSDPEAALGRDKEKIFGPLFTIPALIEKESLMVLAYDVLAQATDARTLPLTLDRVRDVIGRHLKKVVADAGFVSVADLKACAARHVILYGPIQENDFSDRRDKSEKFLPKTSFRWQAVSETYVCPKGHRMPLQKRQRKKRANGQAVELQVYGCPAKYCRSCPLRKQCTRNPAKGRTITRQSGEELLDEHRRRMETAEAKALRKQRGALIERLYGDSKQHRQMRRFHGRGLNNASAETGLVVMVFNAIAWQRLHAKRTNRMKSAG